MEVSFPFSWCLCLGCLLLLWLKPGKPSSDSPECSPRKDPLCWESLVAMPPSQPEPGCDRLGGCRLHFLAPEELPALEEVRDVPEEQQMEFRQILKQAGEGHSKPSPSRARNLLDRLQTVEASVAAVASRLQRLQEENKLNLSRVEERLDSLVVLLMGILSGCKLSCDDSVLKTSILGECTGALLLGLPSLIVLAFGQDQPKTGSDPSPPFPKPIRDGMKARAR